MVEENRTGSRLANAEKEGVDRSEERDNGGRVIIRVRKERDEPQGDLFD